MKINIPDDARKIILVLEMAGYEAYVVGGCVRDSLIGKEPNDWDICTSATPDQVIEVFKGCQIIPTGLQHGTVTIISNGNGYEVTTFRVDGEYEDFRRPKNVRFVKRVKEDLSRRDFTINAMAYSDSAGIVDYFGGTTDLMNRVVSCVGNPEDRFNEDALRILRALRFSSVLGFTISPETSNAIHQCKHLLASISRERVAKELCLMLKGENILNVLLEYPDIIAEIIPEMKQCIGFEQNNKYHQYTVYEHIAHAVANYTGDDVSVNVALLLHDIGKPLCYTEDERGGHFYGHNIPGCDIAEQILQRLKFDNKTKHEVLEIILYHDAVIEPTEKTIRRWLNKIGAERFSQLMEHRIADILAHAEGTQESRIERWKLETELCKKIIEEQQCFSLKDLKINGNHILSLGVSGVVVGETLRHIMDAVIDCKIENELDAEIEEAQRFLMQKR